MKKLMVFLMVLMLCGTAFAGQARVQRVFNARPINGATGTNGNTESSVFQVQSDGYFGAWIKLTTPAPGQGLHTPTVDISCQMSYDQTAGNFATPTSMSLVSSALATTIPTVVSFSPTPMRYMRFTVNGTGANTTGTTITMYMFSQGQE